jgi:GNAT superfamily N-acetyltransferase
MEFTVRRTVQDDWEQFRALRLEMLADTPMGFGERLETAQARTEPEWRIRADRQSDDNIRFAAITSDGEWIGTMGGYVEHKIGGPVLYGVYVTPRFRGGAFGVTDALMSAVEDWAAVRSPTIWLDVHADNHRAQAAYAKRGYVPTGKTLPYELDPAETELEMIKRLR